jgi:hypothetical protein
MTYSPGDPNHLQVHVDLLNELAGYGASILPAIPTLGATTHVDDHNGIIDAINEVAAAWGVTGVPLPPRAVLGASDHVADHNALRAALDYVIANGYNSASGGLEVVVPNYNGSGETWRVHKWGQGGPGTDSLYVARATRPFRVFGSGGAGGGQSSGCCGSCAGPGQYGETGIGTRSLTVGSHTVVIGAGGGGGGWSVNSNPGAPGGASTFDGVTYRGGQGGLYGHFPGNFVQTATDILGNGVENLGARSFGGGCGDHHNGANGETGMLYVAYRIG